MTLKERRMHDRLLKGGGTTVRKMKKLISIVLQCSDAHLVLLEPGDGWTLTFLAADKIGPLRRFVTANGRKFGQLYNYELYEMSGLATALKPEYQTLFTNRSRYDVCFCLDKTKLERR